MNLLKPLALASVLALSITPVLAHEPDSMNGMNMSGMKSSMQGMHDMAVTVTTIDASTGLVDVDGGAMKLRVHFPANTLAGVQVGDKITLHLAFSKP